MQLSSFLVLESQARIVDFHYVWEVKECLSLQPSSLLMGNFFFSRINGRKGIRVPKNLLPLSAVIPLPPNFYKNVTKTKALVNKVQRKSVKLVKPTGGVQGHRERCWSGSYYILSNLTALWDYLSVRLLCEGHGLYEKALQYLCCQSTACLGCHKVSVGRMFFGVGWFRADATLVCTNDKNLQKMRSCSWSAGSVGCEYPSSSLGTSLLLIGSV